MYVAIVSSQTFCQSAHDAAAVPNVTKYWRVKKGKVKSGYIIVRSKA